MSPPDALKRLSAGDEQAREDWKKAEEVFVPINRGREEG